MNAKPIKPQPIRNNRIKRDFKRLLTLITAADEPDYAEVMEIAVRNGFTFDDAGTVKEVRHDRQNNR